MIWTPCFLTADFWEASFWEEDNLIWTPGMLKTGLWEAGFWEESFWGDNHQQWWGKQLECVNAPAAFWGNWLAGGDIVGGGLLVGVLFGEGSSDLDPWLPEDGLVGDELLRRFLSEGR